MDQSLQIKISKKSSKGFIISIIIIAMIILALAGLTKVGIIPNILFIKFLNNPDGKWVYNSYGTREWRIKERPMLSASESDTPTGIEQPSESIVTPLRSTNIIENWQTYIDQNDNYSIEYPAGWIYENNYLNTTVFKVEEGGRWQLQIETKPTENTLQQNADAERELNIKAGYSVETSNMLVGGKPAIKLFLGGFEGIYGDTEIIVVNNGKLYIISQGIGSDPDGINMIKTLKFLE